MQKSYFVINKAVRILFAFSCVASGGFALWSGGLIRGLGGFLSLLFLLVFFFLQRSFAEKIYRIETELLLFMILAFHLGVVSDWYGRFSFYDNLVHFLSGVVFTTVGLCLFWTLRENKSDARNKDCPAAVGFSFCFAQFTAVLWEIFEYVSFLITGHDSQNVAASGVTDTMEDMMACMAGSLVMAAAIYLCLKHNRSCFLLHPADEFHHVICAKKNKQDSVGEGAPAAVK